MSILDLNERSNQPFCFKNLVLSFNGEIYNYRKLRDETSKEGYVFKTTSDTEVVIYLFHKYGLESFLKNFPGYLLLLFGTILMKPYI